MNQDPILRLLGLARKGGRLELGEEPVGAACRARQARLLLLAADAAPNTRRRAAHFGEMGSVPWMEAPFSKEELGLSLGRNSCAMLAVTDAGLAAALGEKLAGRNPQNAPAAAQLKEKAGEALRRQREQRRHEKNLQAGRKKPWAPAPSPQKPASHTSRPPEPARQSGPAPRPRSGGRSRGPGGRRLTGKIQRKP